MSPLQRYEVLGSRDRVNERALNLSGKSDGPEEGLRIHIVLA